MHTMTEDEFGRRSACRAAGFEKEFRAAAVLREGRWEIAGEIYGPLLLKYRPHTEQHRGRTEAGPRPPPNPPEPTAVELATNFAGAMARWILAGVPVVTSNHYAARAAACDACEHWDGQARRGLGKCKAPGCGCTKFKRWLATEKCPLGKWPAAARAESDAAAAGGSATAGAPRA